MSRPFGGDDRPFPLSGHEAQRFGAIVTLENAAGKILVLHRAGKISAAVDEAFEIATELDPTFRFVSVSTPTSVFRDLDGARPIRSGPDVKWGSQAIQLPEHNILGGRRRYMLHPRLRGSVGRADRK